MPNATIQKILKPTKYRAVDTSGNNNHGQIYSGRALEFDGVSDYLTVPDSDAAKPTQHLTVAAWLNIDSNSSWKTIYANSAGWGAGIWCAIDGSESIKMDINGVIPYGSFGTSNNSIEEFTWQRIVWTFTRTGTSMTGRIYNNGVLLKEIDQDSSGVEAVQDITYSAGAMQIGEAGTSSYLYPGKMSDFQLWHKAWTQDEVTFDYLNPESLALNNGGSTLTESDLQLWYPMQDGHRGQQSYVLDGANTGLGDNMVSDGTFDTVTPASTTGTYWTTGDSWSIANGVATNDGTTNNQLDQNINLISGVTYKITFDWTQTSTDSGDKLQFREYDGGAYVVRHEETGHSGGGSGSEEIYFTSTASSINGTLYIRGNNGWAGTVDNVVVQPVNDKHHATTVFYGDELVANGTFETNVDDWTDNSGAGTWERITDGNKITGDGSAHFVGAGSGYTGVCSDAISIVSGRTYQITGNYKVDAAETPAYLDVKVGTNPGNAQVGGWATQTLDEESVTAIDVTFTASETDSTCHLHIRTGNNAAPEIWFDDMSIKEEGTATGWTDADQQLDIPQTALQSYNQLAWFDEVDSTVTVTAEANIDNIFASGGTVSAWIFANGIGENNYGRIFDKGQWYILLSNISGSTSKIKFTHISSGNNSDNKSDNEVIIFGEWMHVVVSYDKDTPATQAKMYINGEEIGVNPDTIGAATMASDGSNDLSIGNVSGGTTRTWDGSITEGSFWDKALSQAEITELYNNGKALDAKAHSANSNLKAYWRNNGLAVWQDLTDNDNDATPTNFAETLLLPAGVDASRDNQGFLMNRQKDTNSLNLPFVETSAEGNYASVPGFNFHATTMSISCWIKTPSYDTGNTILDKYETSGSLRALRLHLTSNNELLLQLSSNGTNYEFQVTTDAALANDTWYHIAITYSSGTWLVYKNASAVSLDAAAFSTTTAIDQNITNLKIGNSIHTSKEPWDGQIDDLCIYNDVLSSDEVDRNYKAGKRSHR
jgi:hypothetical protein